MTGQHHPAPCQKEQGHHRHQPFADPTDAPDAPQDDHAGEQGGDHAHHQPVPSEGVFQGSGDGVGLDHIPTADGGRHTEEGEPHRQGPEPQSPLHVLHGPPLPGAVRCTAAVSDRQRLLGTPGHHTQKGGDPHPEHCPWAAIEDGGGHPGDASGADGGGQGGGEGLELGKAPPLPPPPGPEQGAQGGPQPQPEPEERKPSAPNGVVEPQQQKGPQQPWIPKPVSQPLQKRHVHPSLPKEICAGGEKENGGAGRNPQRRRYRLVRPVCSCPRCFFDR